MQAKDYFSIKELVCGHLYGRDREKCWAYLDPRLLDVLTFIRQGLGRAITVNTWHNGGRYSQRGIRCNLCTLVKSRAANGVLYFSAHMQGMAVDFDAAGMSAEAVRKWIAAHAVELPHPIRLERGTSWVHMDVRTDRPGITYFNGN